MEHSIYYNMDKDSIIKKGKRKTNRFRILMFILLVIWLPFAFYSIHNENKPLTYLAFTLAILAIVAMYKFFYKRNSEYKAILHTDCDPDLFYEIIDDVLENGQKAIQKKLYCKAQAGLVSDKYLEEGYECAKKFMPSNTLETINKVSMQAGYAYLLGNMEEFTNIMDSFLEWTEDEYKKYKLSYDDSCNVMRINRYMYEGQYTEAYKLLTDRKSVFFKPLNFCVDHKKMADCLYHMGDTKLALEYYEKCKEEGGSTSYAKAAAQMIEKLNSEMSS